MSAGPADISTLGDWFRWGVSLIVTCLGFVGAGVAGHLASRLSKIEQAQRTHEVQTGASVKAGDHELWDAVTQLRRDLAQHQVDNARSFSTLVTRDEHAKVSEALGARMDRGFDRLDQKLEEHHRP